MRIKTLSAGGYDAATQILTLQGKTASGGHVSVTIELDDVAQLAEIFASFVSRSGALPALVASELAIEMHDDVDGTTLLCNFELKTGSAFRVAVPLPGVSQRQVAEIEAHLTEVVRLLEEVSGISVH